MYCMLLLRCRSAQLSAAPLLRVEELSDGECGGWHRDTTSAGPLALVGLWLLQATQYRLHRAGCGLRR